MGSGASAPTVNNNVHVTVCKSRRIVPSASQSADGAGALGSRCQDATPESMSDERLLREENAALRRRNCDLESEVKSAIPPPTQ